MNSMLSKNETQANVVADDFDKIRQCQCALMKYIIVTSASIFVLLTSTTPTYHASLKCNH